MKRYLVTFALIAVLMLTLVPSAVSGESVSYKGASQWAIPELDKAAGYGLITESIKDNMAGNITREEFAGIALKLYEVYTGNSAQAGSASFTDTSNPEILKAANLGLVNGVGEGKFEPQTLVTREQMGAILLRTLKVINPTADFTTNGATKFADDASVSSWAKDGVYYCAKYEIIKGTGKNMFSPKGNSTREAAVIVCTRSYEFYKASGSSQEPETAQETNIRFSNDVLTQSILNLDSYSRRIRHVTDPDGSPWEAIKEFAYVKNPVARHIKLDFPTAGSYSEDIIIVDKLWDRMSPTEEWAAYDSGNFFLSEPVMLKYDLSIPYYTVDYGKLTYVKVGTENVNGVNCIKYTVSGSYKDIYTDDYDYTYNISLSASGSIWIADDPIIKQAIIRQRITFDADITSVTDIRVHNIYKDVIEDDITNINSTVILPPS